MISRIRDFFTQTTTPIRSQNLMASPQPVTTVVSSGDTTFISNMACAPIAFDVPENAVRRAPFQPLSDPMYLTMLNPSSCPVPVQATIDVDFLCRLGAPAKLFFQNVMRPTTKHW